MTERPEWVGIDWSPGPLYQEIVAQLKKLLEQERRTLRACYYALKARGHDYGYRKVKRALKKGRQAGMIDPSRVLDSELFRYWAFRDDEMDPYLDGLKERDFAKSYSPDPWRNQGHYVEVWVETKGLAPFFHEFTEKHNIHLELLGGDYSHTGINQANRRFAEKHEEGKECVVLYFGDYNPSGYHMPVVIQKNMQTYGIWQARPEFKLKDEPLLDQLYFEIDGAKWFERRTGESASEPVVEFKRVAMNPDQIKKFDLPENPAPSKSDKDRTLLERFKKHVSGRDVNIELEALKEFHRDYFEDLIEEAILEYRDEEKFEEFQEQVEEERDEIRDRVELKVEQD